MAEELGEEQRCGEEVELWVAVTARAWVWRKQWCVGNTGYSEPDGWKRRDGCAE